MVQKSGIHQLIWSIVYHYLQRFSTIPDGEWIPDFWSINPYEVVVGSLDFELKSWLKLELWGPYKWPLYCNWVFLGLFDPTHRNPMKHAIYNDRLRRPTLYRDGVSEKSEVVKGDIFSLIWLQLWLFHRNIKSLENLPFRWIRHHQDYVTCLGSGIPNESCELPLWTWEGGQPCDIFLVS